jgi:hypothetical protein
LTKYGEEPFDDDHLLPYSAIDLAAIEGQGGIISAVVRREGENEDMGNL